MLPHEDLAPWYDKAVWIYVCRTWREDDADREAARIHDRFGVTSWPHLFLVDPRDDRLLRRAGRTTSTLASAFAAAAAQVEPLPEGELQVALDAMRATQQQVVALEELTGERAAEQRAELLARLDDPDVLVRHRALRLLTPLDVPELAQRAESLLIGGNDAIRFELLDWIQRGAVEGLTPLLVRVFAEAGV